MDSDLEKRNEEENNENSQLNVEEIKTDNNQEKTPYDSDNLSFTPNQRISYKRGKRGSNDSSNENKSNRMEKVSMSNNIHKAKSRQINENNELNEYSTNKKLRNTMTGLNNDKMKYESGLIDMIIKIEKENVNHYLRGDLAEMYRDINEDYCEFKNNVFFANVDHFEKKTGDMDKKPIIPYNCSEDISFRLGTYPKTNDIIAKFAERSKTFQEYV